MRFFPIALIVVGSLGLAKYFGLIPIGMFHVIGPLLLIALGVALLFRRPRLGCGDWHAGHGGGGTDLKAQRSDARVGS